MATHHAQRGMTLTGMVMVLAVAGFFIYCGMKIFPMYSEFGSVKESMEAIAAQPNSANFGKAKVIDLLYRRFNISYVESVKEDNIIFDSKSGATLTIKYEVRRHLMHNLDVVGNFEHSVKLSGN